jgi:hypothetical protein
MQMLGVHGKMLKQALKRQHEKVSNDASLSSV